MLDIYEENEMTDSDLYAVNVKYAVINAATGDNSIVAAVTGKSIKVVDYTLVSTSASSFARFESGTGGTALTGIMPMAVSTVIAPGYCPAGHFRTAEGAALSLEATGDIDGHLTYIEEDI